MPSRALVVLAFVALHLPHGRPTPVAEATARVEGNVVDAESHGPLVGATVTASSKERDEADSAITFSDGTFHLDHVPTGRITIRVRKLGYGAMTLDTLVHPDEVLRVTFVVARAAQALEGVTVREREAAVLYPLFEEHRRGGWGRFLTDEVLRTREHSQTSDVLRTMGSVRLVRLPEGGMAVASSSPPTTTLLEFINEWRGMTGMPYQYACYMQVLLDGARVWSWGTQVPLNVENFPVSSLGGVELYTSAAQMPSAYGGTGATCGVVSFWTRRK